MTPERVKLLRKARELCCATFDNDRNGRANARFQGYVLRHNMEVEELQELNEYEASQADKAAAYLDKQGVTKDGWPYPALLTIARSIVATGPEDDMQGQAVVSKLQDGVRAEANRVRGEKRPAHKK